MGITNPTSSPAALLLADHWLLLLLLGPGPPWASRVPPQQLDDLEPQPTTGHNRD
jgi:hypothetical protein